MSTTKLLDEVDAIPEGEDRDVEVQLSAIVAVRDPNRATPIQQLYHEYKRQVAKTGLECEFVFAVEGNHPAVLDELCRLKEAGENIKILVFSRWYGDATVLSAGFEHASGDVLLTLPDHHQIEPEAIPSLVTALEGHDMVVVRRRPRVEGALTRFQVRAFHAIQRGLLDTPFHDLGCDVRIFKKKVTETVQVYGDQHRFLPVLASHYGYKVDEVDVPQVPHEPDQSFFPVDVCINRLLDLLSVFFLTKFTKKPLRFFGAAGLLVFSSGFVLTMYLTFQRLFMGVALADKPMLLLGVLLIVLGTLFFAIGLIGEMIIFTHSDDLKEYTVDEVID